MRAAMAGAAAALAPVLALAACGKDVDLGGSADAQVADVVAPDAGAGPCEPCVSASDCVAGATCVPIGANTFCALECPNGTCASGETCAVAVVGGTSYRVCEPSGGSCAVAVGPAAADGGIAERCGQLVGPAIDAGCHGCSR